jgi:prepilin-type N-terminal cleavage/methylation domain-containing protein
MKRLEGGRAPRSGATKSRHGGFTLIELLIVVGIIAVLASIAVVNFLEAQVRSKVARAKSDMRAMSLGVEAYAADYNGYPDIFTRIRVITTPVSYLSQVPRDIFRLQAGIDSTSPWRQHYYRYGAMPLDTASRYVIASLGPDTDIDTYSSLNTSGGGDNENTANFEPDNQALRLYPGYSPALFSEAGAVINAATFKYIQYDPTNGSISNGDIFRMSDHQMN